LVMKFVPPEEEERRQAIGSLEGMPPALRTLIQSADFEPILRPSPNDWLANHAEPGQTFDEFRRSHRNRPDASRHTIYLQPLDDFPASGPPVPTLMEFAAAFFAMRVRVPPVVPHQKHEIRSRINLYTGQPQLLTRDVLALLSQRLPLDAFCVLAITLQDLYPDPSWNFVFGEASLNDRVGVYSFARYDPRFYGEDARDRTALMLNRSCKVLAHETCHMFGIAHCIYFHCLMNGSNHMTESDARSMHLCPVDLRKLYDSIRFDPLDRYGHLKEFYQKVGFKDEAVWIDAQLARVAGKTNLVR
jgi:archaemetzincin